MLKIRFQRTGRINDASFKLIVVEHTEPAKTGDFVERLGTYNPRTKEKNLDVARINYWISKGAQPSPTVHNVLISEGVIQGKKINVLPKKTVPKVESEQKTENNEQQTTAEAEKSTPASEALPETVVA